jgi:mannose-6-phosphate isomerase-like protein (cupin superfamily)
VNGDVKPRKAQRFNVGLKERHRFWSCCGSACLAGNMNLLKAVHRMTRAKMTGYFGSIESETLKNKYFRRVLFTGKHAQLVVMCLKEGEEIGNEVHQNVDQFFRVEKGKFQFILNNGKEKHVARNGDAVIVPAGTWHNVINISNRNSKLYTIYSPPNHPDGTIHRTKKDAELAEAKERKA